MENKVDRDHDTERQHKHVDNIPKVKTQPQIRDDKHDERPCQKICDGCDAHGLIIDKSPCLCYFGGDGFFEVSQIIEAYKQIK